MKEKERNLPHSGRGRDTRQGPPRKPTLAGYYDTLIGGGVVAGSVGMLCFYTALKGAPLTRAMPIAFTAPLFGALMGLLFGGETLTLKTAVGILLTVGGIILLTV